MSSGWRLSMVRSSAMAPRSISSWRRSPIGSLISRPSVDELLAQIPKTRTGLAIERRRRRSARPPVAVVLAAGLFELGIAREADGVVRAFRGRLEDEAAHRGHRPVQKRAI